MEIIPAASYSNLKLAHVLTRYIHCTPYVWADGIGLQLKPQRYQVYLWYLHVCLVVAYTSFVAFRCAHVYNNPQSSIVLKIYITSMCIFYICYCFYQLNTAANVKRIPMLINGYLQFFQNVQSEKERANGGKLFQGRGLWIANLFCKFLCYGFRTNIAVMSAYVLLQPESPELLSSLVSNPHGCIVGRIVCGVFHLHMLWSYGEASYQPLVVAIVMITSMTQLSKNLSESLKINPGHMATRTNVLRMYRQMSVVTKEFCELYSLQYGSTQATVMGVIIFVLSAGLRQRGIFALGPSIFAFNVLIALMGFLFYYGETNEKSGKLLVNMTHAINGETAVCTKWFKRERKSLRPLRIWVGSMYYFDKGLVLTTLKTIIENVVTFSLM